MVLNLAVPIHVNKYHRHMDIHCIFTCALNSVILYPSIDKIFLFHNRMNFDHYDNDKTKSILVRVMAL